MLCQNQARDFVLRRDERLDEKLGERYVGQTHLGGSAFLGRVGGEPGQLIAGTERRRLGQQRGEGVEPVRPTPKRDAVDHDAASLGEKFPPDNRMRSLRRCL